MITKSVRIYFSYFKQFLKTRLVYKGDFFASLIANVLVAASGLVFIVLLIDGKIVPGLRGWTREEVLFIYGYSMISVAIFSTVSINLYQFGDRYIIEGQFDRVLVRPLNSLCQVLFESFNLDTLGTIIVGVAVLIYSSTQLSIDFNATDYLWLAISTISGGLILISVFVTLASFSFHFEDRIGITPPFYNMIMFGRYPLPIFNGIIQFLLKWVVPFAFVAFYPATHFLSREGFSFFCYFTPAMAVISMIVMSILWQFGVSRYTSTGS